MIKAHQATPKPKDLDSVIEELLIQNSILKVETLLQKRQLEQNNDNKYSSR